MLEQLFGSTTRVKLLRLFLNNPSQPFYLRELARKIKTQLNSIRREIDNLEKIGIVKSVQLAASTPTAKVKHQPKIKKSNKKYFLVDSDFILFPELKALLLKAQLLLERSFVSKIEKMSAVKLFILTGAFVGIEGFATDMLVVGMVNRKKLAGIVKDFEKELNHSINYTSMTVSEFRYRQDITDRFLYDILEGRKIIIIDKISDD
ncbi:MAG: hypothetical protein A2912_04645 [Candidatus Buchananbacteria bacterium RIFCSPLOWO2_01_FULL_40_23b]|uniref:HTH arsR-type domain-containing protein n=1 Tax=Candidatus Buchananbacteria bacterium RIFCSPLOWO2_01_FULL_40_23b TaxID=1797544 RepID=A0A1G1YS92_9BACT|nr:MAG: hypothetical protein A2912_04645 [Candidatus Buchananbacteria bacterium RIFCSPLOWO2_01_FULL_40_23b]